MLVACHRSVADVVLLKLVLLVRLPGGLCDLRRRSHDEEDGTQRVRPLHKYLVKSPTDLSGNSPKKNLNIATLKNYINTQILNHVLEQNFLKAVYSG